MPQSVSHPDEHVVVRDAAGGFTLRVRRIASSRDVSHESSRASTRPALVFLHDSLGCVETWRDFPQRLADAVGLDALVYDRRGYGRSSPFGSAPRRPDYLHVEADVLLALLDALGVREAVLFGHSDGGSIALLTAARSPERVRAVITEGAHVFVEELTLAGIRAAREAFATTDLRERVARHHGEKTDGVASAWIDVWLSPEFRDWNIEASLPAIRCPVLAIQGEDDEYGTPDQVRAIVQGVGERATGLMLPRCAHTPHREATEAVMAASTEFLAATAGGDPLPAP